MADRRPIASRSSGVIRRLAHWLAATPVAPNQISVASVLASGLVPVGVLCLDGWCGNLLAAVGIQLRLLANVLDGLVAVEGGKSSPLGALYNEFPDRIADSLILVSLGMAAGLPALGWLAALLAALTAYVRVFGGSLGLPQAFLGPMAKQHRMAVATAALVLEPCLAGWIATACLWATALGIICVGSALTCARRTQHIAGQLAQRSAATATDPTGAGA